MAYIKSYATASSGTATSIAVDEMPEHSSGDLIIAVYQRDGSGSAFTCANYTEIESRAAQAITMSAFYKVATSSTESPPLGVSSSGDPYFHYLLVVANADTTQPINQSASNDANSNSITAASVSPPFFPFSQPTKMIV